jgi:hypothetical protein
MIWKDELSKTGQDAADRFAASCWDEPREIDPESFKPAKAPRGVLAYTFQLVDGSVTYRLEGTQAGWTVSKEPPPC